MDDMKKMWNHKVKGLAHVQTQRQEMQHTGKGCPHT